MILKEEQRLRIIGSGYELENQVLAIMGIPMIIIILYIFMVIIPMIAMEVRRYHDVGKSAGLLVLHIMIYAISIFL